MEVWTQARYARNKHLRWSWAEAKRPPKKTVRSQSNDQLRPHHENGDNSRASLSWHTIFINASNNVSFEPCSILCNNLNGKRIWKRIDTCICITEPLCCTPETNTTLFFFFFFFNLFIFCCVGSSLPPAGFLQLRWVGAPLRCGARASHCGGFSCCGARALGAWASVVVARGLSSCGSQAELLRGMWDLPRPGLEPVSPDLAGRFLTPAPPGKSLTQHC